MTQTKRTHKTVLKSAEKHSPAQQTFMEHIHELQSRLFYIAIVFLITAGAAYPFFTDIAAFIVAPLGEQQLVYLTPGGAFSFVIKICMYVGFVASLPVIIYHLFQFLSPVMPVVMRKRLPLFTFGSFFLALSGVAFAYYVSLPAALYFLTSFSVANIDPMLTIDSYFSFAMAYLIAGALLFQLPLVLLIIDSISPLTPRQLMGYQRHVLLGSVILAAILSPTPDVLNQLLLAAPIVVMYQLGIVMIANQHRARKKHQNTPVKALSPVGGFTNDMLDELFKEPVEKPVKPVLVAPVQQPTVQKQIIVTAQPIKQRQSQLTNRRSIDGFRASPPRIHVPNREVSQHLRRNVVISRPARSVDGIISSSRLTA